LLIILLGGLVEKLCKKYAADGNEEEMEEIGAAVQHVLLSLLYPSLFPLYQRKVPPKHFLEYC
jgi:hypothetical protein